VARAAGFVPALGGTLISSGRLATSRGDLERARSAFHEVLRSRDQDSRVNVLQALEGLGVLALADRDYEAAGRWFQESGEVAQASGSPGGDSRVGLAVVAIATGELAQARELIEEPLELMAASDTPPSPRMLALLADVALLQADLDEAERFGRNAVEH